MLEMIRQTAAPSEELSADMTLTFFSVMDSTNMIFKRLLLFEGAFTHCTLESVGVG